MNQIQDRSGVRADLGSAERVLAGFGHSERVQALLLPRLEGLIETIPRLRAWRGFSGGAWAIGARTATDEARTTRADYSRIDFEIRIDGDAGRASVVCRSTIRSRDQRTEQVELPLDASGLEHLSAWFETM
ncbi:MAG TPA: hypothetical protein VFD43_11075, partial [Planctomycetota bacterium]|nr:hypothetical protein [Planctomycetota bacterium]